MPILITEVPAAVRAYLETVTIMLGDLTSIPSPESGREYSFSISARNPANGVPLKNVAYRLWVTDPKVAKLRVPDRAGVTATTIPGATFPPATTPVVLTPGTLVNEMCLVSTARDQRFDVPWAPPDLQNVLGVGDTDKISGLLCHVSLLGTCEIKGEIMAEVDVNALFPKAPSLTASMSVGVPLPRP
jgi:hypothetical protein